MFYNKKILLIDFVKFLEKIMMMMMHTWFMMATRKNKHN